MKLSLLLKQVPVQNTYEDREITFITDDSRKIQPGCAFVCIKGNHFDGHDAAFDAVRRGAAAVIVQHSVGCEGEVITSNTRAAYSLMCAAFFGEPAKKLRLIGVTGTNGKTTTTFLIKEILDMFGKKSGLIGTVVNMIDQQAEPAALTTPESFALQQLFAKMVQAGCEYCVMEVSSQALSQGRVEGCMFEVAVFTNLTQDHLDYHGNFENYAAAKAILFSQCKKAVLNSDDPAWHRMIRDSSCPYVTYAQKQQADYRAAEIQYAQTGVRYQLRHAEQCFDTAIGIPGEFSVYNSLCAITALAELGFSLADVVEKAAKVKGVKGRIEVVPTDTDYVVIIDYAHSNGEGGGIAVGLPVCYLRQSAYRAAGGDYCRYSCRTERLQCADGGRAVTHAGHSGGIK